MDIEALRKLIEPMTEECKVLVRSSAGHYYSCNGAYENINGEGFIVLRDIEFQFVVATPPRTEAP